MCIWSLFLQNDVWNRFMWDSDYKWCCCLGRSVDPSIWGQPTLFMTTFSIMPPPPPWHTIISQKQPELCFPLIFSAPQVEIYFHNKKLSRVDFRPDVCRVVLWSKINLFHSCCFLHKCEPFITCITQCQGGRDTAGETIFKHESDMLNFNLKRGSRSWTADNYSCSIL